MTQNKFAFEGLENSLSNKTSAALGKIDTSSMAPTIKVLPDVWVIKIGGQSIMDRGREAVYPILEELLEAKKQGVKFILCTGGGTRARHAYAIGMDIGMPTGALARIGASVPVQNARMLQMLLAKDGGIMCYEDDFEKLPMYLETGMIPLMSGMPPFEFWEKTPEVGMLPQNRTDAGTYLLGEFFGAKGVLYIKDEDGLYSDDPKKNPDAEFIKNITSKELLDSGQDDLIVERNVLKFMESAQNAREIRIINGTKKGNITAALNGEDIGTLIKAL